MMLPETLREDWANAPLATDAKVRVALNIPDDRYYTVSRWPEPVAWVVRLTPGITRVLRSKKISKSDDSSSIDGSGNNAIPYV